jgi:hypothetical protein
MVISSQLTCRLLCGVGAILGSKSIVTTAVPYELPILARVLLATMEAEVQN